MRGSFLRGIAPVAHDNRRSGRRQGKNPENSENFLAGVAGSRFTAAGGKEVAGEWMTGTIRGTP